jgi:DNA polymerase
MNKKQIFDTVAFYCDNDLDFICDETSQNRYNQVFLPKNFQTKTTNIIKIPTTNLSTRQAISMLAQKNLLTDETNAISLENIISKAKNIAQSCNDLDSLKIQVQDFDGCNLKKMATNTVFGDGNPNSKILIIGEAPGSEEDIQGIPFCGDSGIMLSEMFAAINLHRQQNFYITNTVFWRPPGNRQPTPEELAICRPFLERAIQIIKPKLIILIGATASCNVLHCKDQISKIHGKINDFNPSYLDYTSKTICLFHPSFLMRQPSKKKLVWQDLLTIEQYLNNV